MGRHPLRKRASGRDPPDVHAKEENLEDAAAADDDAADILERLSDGSLEGEDRGVTFGGPHPQGNLDVRFARLDFVLAGGQLGTPLSEGLLETLACAAVDMIRAEKARPTLPEHGQFATHWVFDAFFAYKTTQGDVGDRVSLDARSRAPPRCRSPLRPDCPHRCHGG